MAENNRTDTGKRYFKWIPGFIRHDFLRKLVALIFTGIVMYYVYPRSEEHTDDYPIQQIRVRLEPADGYLLESSTPDHVNAVFEGDKGKLNMLKASDLIFKVAIGEDEWKNQKVTLNKDHLKFLDLHQGNGNIQLKTIAPAEIKLKMTKIVDREFPITAVYDESELPKGYYVESVSFPEDGNKVKVHGDEALLNQMTEVKTMPIPLKNQIAGFTMKVKLDKRGLENSKDKQIYKDEVVVNVIISRNYSKTFMNLPIQVLLSPDQLGKFTVELSRKEADVQLSGRKDIMENLQQNEVHPYLDLTQSGQGYLELHCTVDKPGTNLLSVGDKIRVTLKKIENAEKPEEETDKK